MNIIIAIESSLVRLDVEDTLRDIGGHQFRSFSSALRASAALNNESSDAVILGLDVSGPGSQALVDTLERLHIPIVIVASGVNNFEMLPRLTRAKSLCVPFDKQSLANALECAVLDRVRPPDAS